MKEQRHYELLNTFWENSSKKVFYSFQRVDLIVIAISTGAMQHYLDLLEMLKNRIAALEHYSY
jgi:hypothetical protein